MTRIINYDKYVNQPWWVPIIDVFNSDDCHVVDGSEYHLYLDIKSQDILCIPRKDLLENVTMDEALLIPSDIILCKRKNLVFTFATNEEVKDAWTKIINK